MAEIVRANLRALGIDVAIKPFPILAMFRREFTPGEPFDIGWWGWSADFADPSDFMDIALAYPGPRRSLQPAPRPAYRRRIAAALDG